MDEWTFSDEIKLQPLNLPRAALLFARELAYPTLHVPAYMLKIEELAQAAQPHVHYSQPVTSQAEMLSEFLFQRAGFRGNADAYYDPRNSYLNDVIERRLGIPITLSLLFIAVAHRLQIPAVGVGMPGHFITAVRAENKAVFFDPFNGGGRLSLTDCARLVRLTTGYRGPFRQEWLQPAPPALILTRMLNNLRHHFVQTQAWPKAIAALERLQQLNPDSAELVRDRGMAHYQAGEMRRAAQYLDAYLQHAPNAPDAANIRAHIRQKLDNWAQQN